MRTANEAADLSAGGRNASRRELLRRHDPENGQGDEARRRDDLHGRVGQTIRIDVRGVESEKTENDCCEANCVRPHGAACKDRFGVGHDRSFLGGRARKRRGRAGEGEGRALDRGGAAGSGAFEGARGREWVKEEEPSPRGCSHKVSRDEKGRRIGGRGGGGGGEPGGLGGGGSPPPPRPAVGGAGGVVRPEAVPRRSSRAGTPDRRRSPSCARNSPSPRRRPARSAS